MAFLGNPCPCGYSFTEHEDGSRECEHCDRRFERRSWGTVQVTPLDKIKVVSHCHHRRLVGETCPHCLNGIAS